ncbi:MAG: BlaI/MecI/CopY family transcriptional regulator [Saprospiraceae bacterium]|nr:BlaI/MecI/CopY family transcriptional regulator [Lewinella sp.]
MSDSPIYEPSDSELEILQILWANEPATVRFVHEQINLKREVGYTTVLKQLQRLTDKGVVKRKRKGKVHYYSVVPKRDDVQQNLFQQFLENVYEGSAMKLIMDALGQSQTSEEELDELKKWIEQQKKQKND